MSEEAVARTDEEKAKMYAAMLGGANVITSVLASDNEFGNDLTNAEKQERVLRSAGYLEYGKALGDWGSEDFSAIDCCNSRKSIYTIRKIERAN